LENPISPFLKSNKSKDSEISPGNSKNGLEITILAGIPNINSPETKEDN